MTVEKMFPSGGYKIYQLHKGHLVIRQYFGYTKREAMQLFREEVSACK